MSIIMVHQAVTSIGQKNIEKGKLQMLKDRKEEKKKVSTEVSIDILMQWRWAFVESCMTLYLASLIFSMNSHSLEIPPRVVNTACDSYVGISRITCIVLFKGDG